MYELYLNRNFEGRINPHIKIELSCFPPLVVIYALAGRIDIDIYKDPICVSKGKKIFFKDLWPSKAELTEFSKKCKRTFIKRIILIFLRETNSGKN